MYCHNCGAQLPDDAAFCVKCGTSTGINTVKANFDSWTSSCAFRSNILEMSELRSADRAQVRRNGYHL